jgi:glycosyltransferase involved in cell wall biosynthesis
MNAHNSAEFLHEALSSVVAQTMPFWEIILWDNASSDNSEEIAASFNDSRIRYFQIPERAALYESRIAAFRHVRGEVAAFLDCDDTWMRKKLELQVKTFDDPRCVISCTDFVISRERKRGSKTKKSLSTFHTYEKEQSGVLNVLRDYRLGMSSIMVRSSAAKIAWPTDPPPFFMIEDVDMVGRLMTKGVLIPVPIPLMTYRRHGNNYSSRQDPFAREWETWIANLADYDVAESEREGLAAFGAEQSARARYRAALLAGRRAEALEQSRHVVRGRDRVKMMAALALPTSVTWKLVR